MNKLTKSMNNVIKFLSFIDKRKMLVNVYVKDDEESMVKFIPALYTKRTDNLPVRFMPRTGKFEQSADLNIIMNSYKSDEGKIILDKSRMLSEKIAEISFYYADEDAMNEALYYQLRLWAKSRKDVEFTAKM